MCIIEGFGLYLNAQEKCMIYQQSNVQEARVALLEDLVNET